jgi:hypothetical protein
VKNGTNAEVFPGLQMCVTRAVCPQSLTKGAMSGRSQNAQNNPKANLSKKGGKNFPASFTHGHRTLLRANGYHRVTEQIE